MRPFCLSLVLLASAEAFAQDCPELYTHTRWKADMDAADESLAAFNLEQAREQLVAVHRGVLCLDSVARPSYVARVARQLAIVFFYDQDEAAAIRWSAGSQFAYGGLAWPSDMGEEHPMRAVLAEAEAPSLAGPEDKGLIVPKKGYAFVDGGMATTLKVPVETPVLVQITDKDGLITRQYWQDGAAWPEDLLGPPAPAPLAPKWLVAEAPDQIAKLKDPMWGGPAVASVDPEEDPVETPPDTEVAVVAVVTPPVVPVKPPPVIPVKPVEPIPEGTPVAVASTASLAAYVDPFLDAKMRAIVKERSVRTEVDASGKTRTVTTEVITFVDDKQSAGAVKASDFADWIAYRPEWQREAAIADKRADKGYLSTWVNGVQPGDPAAPAVWISFLAAKGYCDDWSSGLADGSVAAPAVVDEWRQIDGKPALRSTKSGAALYTGDLLRTAETIGFRCVN